ncbi:MAG: PEGA domain-containing protein [Candidatus Acidiferrales bacterium]
MRRFQNSIILGASPGRQLSLRWLALALLTPAAFAESLTITSVPPGASVEINGNLIGRSSCKVDYPSVYFHKPPTASGERLGHPVVLRISKSGFLTRQITLSDGPFDWVGLTGKKHGTYFVLRSNHFELKLDSTSDPSNAAVGDEEKPGPLRSARSTADRIADYPSDSGSVNVSSDPTGADIYVNGNFAGQTPSTLHLTAGIHRIEVKADAHQPWIRELQIAKGSSVSVRPTLVADAGP